MSEIGQNLPTTWATEKLSAVAQINPPLDRCIIHDDAEVDFVPMRAVEPEGGGLLRPEVRAYGTVKKGYTAFLPGDVISAKITPCMENGKTCVAPKLSGAAYFGSTEFHVLRPEAGIEARWIANFLLQHSTRQAAQRRMGGAVGQMRVPQSFLEELELPIPPAAEQQRILELVDELLSDLDAGVAALERVQAKLKHYRAAVLKAAVEGALTAEWREAHPATEPASELLTRILAERRRLWEEAQMRKFKEAGKEPPKNWKARYEKPTAPDLSALATLPEGWCWASVEQLAWAAGYGISEKCRADNVGLAVLRIPNVAKGRLSLEALKYAPSEYSEREEDLVSVGDLLIVRTNGSRGLIGRGAVTRLKPSLPLSFASYLIRLRLVPLPHLLAWVSCIWDSAPVRHWIETRAATSAGQHNISLGVLKTLVLPLPPANEQVALAESLEGQLSVIEHLGGDLEAKLASAQALRQSILRHAFTGQLVPQDPNDEPAAELLRRIATERAQRADLAQAVKPKKTRTAHKCAVSKH